MSETANPRGCGRACIVVALVVVLLPIVMFWAVVHFPWVGEQVLSPLMEVGDMGKVLVRIGHYLRDFCT